MQLSEMHGTWSFEIVYYVDIKYKQKTGSAMKEKWKNLIFMMNSTIKIARCRNENMEFSWE